MATSSRRGRSLTIEETRLWRAAMQDVKPLTRCSAADSATPAPPAAAPPPLAAPAAPLPPPAPTRRPPSPPPAAAGIDRQTLRRLKSGDLPIEGVLDLHGLTRDAAHAALRHHILAAAAAGRRCLLVVTGKGSARGAATPDDSGVLRREVPRWLDDWRPPVLAFAAAGPRHGGTGALYVLLKRRR